MVMQCRPDLRNYPGDAAGVIGLGKVGEDVPDLVVPKCGADLAVYPFVTKQCQLAVFERDVYKYGVPSGGLLHIETGEYLGGPVERVDITAATFYIYPDLAAGLSLGGLDGGDDLRLLGLCKSHLFREVWNIQRNNLNV